MQREFTSDDPLQKGFEISAFDQELETAVVTAYAEALSNTKKVYELNQCYAYGNAEGCIVTETNPEGICASCEAEVVSDAAIQEIPAIAEASVHLIASPVVQLLSVWLYFNYTWTKSLRYMSTPRPLGI